jgi:hypothetical protein
MTSLPLSLSLSFAPALALALSRVMSGGVSSSNVPPLPPSLAPVGVPPPSPRSRVQESSLSWDELAEAEAWLAGTHRSGRTGAGRIARRHTAYLANARPNKKHRLEEARDVRRREGNAEAVGKAAVIGRPSLSSAFAGPPQPKRFFGSNGQGGGASAASAASAGRGSPRQRYAAAPGSGRRLCRARGYAGARSDEPD